MDEALSRLLTGIKELEAERVPLEAALDRVLREELRAAAPLPPHDYSAMDGYAVDTRSLPGAPPFELPVAGESRTGRVAPRLAAGSACRIFTGAMLPEGADAVVMQEDVTVEHGVARLVARPAPGDHVRRAGEDLASGAVALEAGARLGPYQLGLAAALDRGELLVSRRPRVTVLCTGDELRPPGSPARAGSIPESNGIALAALARRASAEVTRGDTVPDDRDEASRRITAALDASDVLVTVGGVSVGDHDVVRPALEAAGVTLDFYKVAIKPGKPLTFGRRGATVVLGLPGNPVSAQVTFALFGLPLLRALTSEQPVLRTPRAVRLGAAIRQKPGRQGYYAARVAGDVATPLAAQSSGSTTSLARADALVILPADSDGLPAGAPASALFLGDL